MLSKHYGLPNLDFLKFFVLYGLQLPRNCSNEISNIHYLKLCFLDKLTFFVKELFSERRIFGVCKIKDRISQLYCSFIKFNLKK